MSGMGDMVPRLDLTDAQERAVDRLERDIELEIQRVITGKELYELVDMQGWIDELKIPRGVILIHDRTPWEQLETGLQESWEALASSWRELLRAHVDEDRVKDTALGEDLWNV